MNRSILIFSVAFMLALASVISAQDLPCGIVSVDATTKVAPGTPIVFKAKVKNLPTSTPEFRWWVSSGKIVKGEGTEEITVDTTGLGGFNVTVTVQLAATPPPGCVATNAVTIQILPDPPPKDPVDTYGDIPFADEKARLDNFIIQIENLYQSRGVILMSAGPNWRKGEVAFRLERLRKYLKDVRQFDLTRLKTVDCGTSKELNTMLYVVPFGSASPTCDKSGKN